MLLHNVGLLGLIAVALAQVPYSEYNLTPRSRTILPASVYNVNGSVETPDALNVNGSVETPDALTCSSTATFNGISAVTYDFGKNIGGIVSFDPTQVLGNHQYIGISFTESSLWIHSEGCDAIADAGIDAVLWFPVQSGGSYQASEEHQRGALRYLNVYHNTTGSVEVSGLFNLLYRNPPSCGRRHGSLHVVLSLQR